MPAGNKGRGMGLSFNFEDEEKKTEEAAADVARYMTTYAKSTRLDLARRLREQADEVQSAYQGDQAVEEMTSDAHKNKQ